MIRTHQQNKELHALLHNLSDKELLVSQYSNGRTTTSAELKEQECDELINALRREVSNTEQLANRQRRRVISHLIEAGYTNADGRADMPKIYAWVKRQKHKKNFNDLTSSQLSELIYAAENLKSHYLKKVDDART